MIRPAQLKDAEAICEVHKSAIRGLCSSHYQKDEIEAWTSMPKPEAYRSVMADDKKLLLVAEQNDEIVGFGQVDFRNQEIEAVYVSPEVAGSGVGKKLLTELEDASRKEGLKTLRLSASLNACGFYKKAGYRKLDNTKHTLRSGIQIGCVNMEKKI
ncbi:MAG TPA: GNAT family N-acetyltransferase [Bacillales bacterium]|nr:GNAT family N-acetyltransferase [Bacillales bacterium]